MIKLENNELQEDSGSRIIDALKIFKKHGCCPEFLFHYIIPNFNKIPNINLINFSCCKLLNYSKISKFSIKDYLLSNIPVMCGIKIFSSFHSKKTIETGIINLPTNIDYLLGGHSIVIIGYNDCLQSYIFINSWGKSWGNNGFGFIPYNYINNHNYSNEFFILYKINNPNILLVDHKHTNVDLYYYFIITNLILLLLLLNNLKLNL